MASYKKKSREEVKAQKKRLNGCIEAEQDHIWFEVATLKEFLLFAVKFRRYSYHNQVLIHAQKPGATMVHTYKQWMDCKRQVKRGEKGIEIFAPSPRKRTVEKEKLDAKGKKMIGADGKVVKEEETIAYMDYRVEYVYDYSQTEGNPIPELETTAEDPIYETDGDLHAALKKVSGDVLAGIPIEDMILTVAQTEMKRNFGICEDQEAKACAYILAGYLQTELPDTYAREVFSWAKGRDGKEISAFMKKVQATSLEIIKKMEQEESTCTRPLSV